MTSSIGDTNRTINSLRNETIDKDAIEQSKSEIERLKKAMSFFDPDKITEFDIAKFAEDYLFFTFPNLKVELKSPT